MADPGCLRDNLIIHKGSGKGEAGAVCAVSFHDICAAQIDQIIVCQPFCTSAHERRGESDPAVIHQKGQPVEKMTVPGAKIRNHESICIQFIRIDISVGPFRDCPLSARAECSAQ